MTTHVLTYEEAFAQGSSIAGGKAWNLARLARYGFLVPRGGVLPADVYRRVVAHSLFRQQIESLHGIAAEEVANPQVGQRLAALADAIRTHSLDAEATTALREFLAGDELAHRRLAVRSSAIAEDGTTASFAGIHESSLNVSGLEAVCQAVLDCFASLWTPQALAYRRRMKIADADVACAVLLCEMVHGPGGGVPQAAGVAFSCDPVSGRRDVITLNLAAGLGDAVVRGSVTPDRYVLDPAHPYRILERQLVGRPQLSDPQLIMLARLVWRVHWALGAGQIPQDVEWAFDGREFWLVQSRPVTRLPRYTFREIISQPTYWSNGNFKDSFPEPVTTMTAAMTELVVRDVLFASQSAVGHAVPPGMPVMQRVAGRFYFDLAALQWSLYDAFGILPAEVNRTTGGFQPEIAVPAGNPLAGRAGRARSWRRLKLLRALGRFRRHLPERVARVFAENCHAQQTDLTALSDAALAIELERRITIGNAFVPQLQLAASYYGAWITVLQDFLARVTGDWRQGLVTRLLAGTGGVVSAEHGYRLIDLAELAREDPAVREAVTDDDPESWRRLPADAAFRREFAHYLAAFGHRGVLEMEFASTRWREDPTYLLRQIAMLLEAPASFDLRQRATQIRQSAEAELVKLAWPVRPIAWWLLAKARTGAVVREQAKSAAAASVDTMRMTLLEAGRRFAGRKWLDAPGDVFHLSVEDVRALLDGTWGGEGARSLVADRRHQMALDRASSPPDLIVEGGGVSRPNSATRSLPNSDRNGDAWRGYAAAPGTAEGTARVIDRATEGEVLRPGEVLVAPSTDPGWTPLFLRASAIVMETGGYLSHGAVVAREYGIPAVVNVAEAMKVIASGDSLLVDGDRGEVRRLKRGPKQIGSAANHT